jgi:hypothetical protein
VFAHVRPERVRASAREPNQLHPRPTFHYRLPNSQVDDAGWSFAEEWNRWVEVERLAADDRARAELGEAYLACVDEDDPTAAQRWAKEVALARALPR